MSDGSYTTTLRIEYEGVDMEVDAEVHVPTRGDAWYGIDSLMGEMTALRIGSQDVPLFMFTTETLDAIDALCLHAVKHPAKEAA